MFISKIRNFSIIAHIDHGKSTLADRLLLKTGTISEREFRNQVLDDMDLERERGITIKASAVSMDWVYEGERYELNLIDTPGHVDFSYEVSKSLTACEGTLLVVDAAKGVQAQTVANVYLALEHNLTIIPIINKIDLPNARPMEVMEEMEEFLDIDPADVLLISAKTGEGVNKVLQRIFTHIPPPQGDDAAPLKALIFDSVFNTYRGVISYIRVFDGTLRKGDHIYMIRGDARFEVDEVGTFRPQMVPCDEIRAGDVGYLIANIKSLESVKIGDTITHQETMDVKPLPGYVEPKPMVFCGLYPVQSGDFDDLRDALDKLKLNDSSFTFQPETSEALGFGFRCGFLGLLHMEIIQERLERESNLELVQTAPNVTYEVITNNNEVLYINNPSELPNAGEISEIREPMVRVSMVCPKEYIGVIMTLSEDKRGTFKSTHYLSPTKVDITYDLPLAEIVFDFYDKLKSITRGYGTMDYEFIGFRPEKLVKLDILVAGAKVDALSSIVHKDNAYYKGRKLVQKLKKEIDRHLFEVVIQAAISSKIIARESIRPLSKNVTAKCYGGDITRKRKLLEKQKEGKKRMKKVGNVDIPQKAFLAVLGTD